MYVETILNLSPTEADAVEKCIELLEDIFHNFPGECLGSVERDEIAYASDVLLRLNTEKKVLKC